MDALLLLNTHASLMKSIAQRNQSLRWIYEHGHCDSRLRFD